MIKAILKSRKSYQNLESDKDGLIASIWGEVTNIEQESDHIRIMIGNADCWLYANEIEYTDRNIPLVKALKDCTESGFINIEGVI